METVQINREHEQGILDMINKHPIFSFNDIFVYYKACSRATAYNHHLDKLDTIKEAIYSNKRQGVQTLLSKWLKSENATLQLAAMRMVCDSDEHRKLNQNYTDVTSQNEKINTVDPFALMRENHAINSETEKGT
jgi:hypothetical protein